MTSRIAVRLYRLLLAAALSGAPMAVSGQTAATPQDVITNATGGQLLGGWELFRPMPTLQTGKPGVAGTTQQDFYLQELVPGADGTLSQYSRFYNEPQAMMGAGGTQRLDATESGCAQTSFEYVESGSVLSVEAVQRWAMHGSAGTFYVDTPYRYNGPVDLGFATLGYSRAIEKVLQPVSDHAPGVVLKYQLTPFPFPRDGSYVTYNHRVEGGSGSVVAYGAPGDGFATQGGFTMDGDTLTVQADLYRVVQTFAPPPPDGCASDPSSCVVGAIDFCTAPGLGIAEVFQRGQRVFVQATDLLDVSGNRSHVQRGDPAVQAMMSASQPVIDGTSALFDDVFKGCAEESSSSTTTHTVHRADVYTCQNVRDVGERDGCSAQRNLHFAYVATATTLTVSAYQKVEVPVLDSHGNPVLDASGNRVYQTSIIPSVWIGPVDVAYPTVGSQRSFDTDADANGYFLHYELTPFSGDPHQNFTYAQRLLGGNFTGEVTNYGATSDGWSTHAVVSANGMSELRLQADLYAIASNSITGCSQYLAMGLDGFCTPNMSCDVDDSPCATVDGVTFCSDGSGPAAGLASLLVPWGGLDSASSNLTAGAGRKDFLPLLCSAAHGAPMQCPFFNSAATAQHCYASASGAATCIDVDTDGLAQNFGDPSFRDDCASTYPPNGKGPQALFSNPNCTLVGTAQTRCVEGAQGLFSGVCYVYSVPYDCGVDDLIQVPGSSSVIQSCGGPIRCMGTECHNPANETNADFAKAAAAGSLADMMKGDTTCAETGKAPAAANQPCTPMIFSGQSLYCKVPVGHNLGLTPNCCSMAADAAAGIDATKYLQLAMYTYRLAQQPAVASALAHIPGYAGFIDDFQVAATPIKGAINATLQPLTDGFSSMMNSLGWQVTDAASEDLARQACTVVTNGTPLAGAVSEFAQELGNGVHSVAASLFGPDFAERLLNGTSGATGDASLASAGVADVGVAEVVDAVNLVFTVYSILRIIGNIVFACQTEELQMGVQRQLGNCAYVGDYCAIDSKLVGCVETRSSYCCYKTPLARIVASQLRSGQGIGGGYGSPSAPRCEGFSAEELAQADWSRVDLSEWVTRLQHAGLIASDSSQAGALYGGSQSSLSSIYGVALPGPDGYMSPPARAQEQIGGQVEQISTDRQSLASQATCYGDPNYSPWYGEQLRPDQVVQAVGGSGYMVTCGEGCLDVKLGSAVNISLPPNTFGDAGRCRPSDYATEAYTVKILRPELIDSAAIDEAYFDDHLQVIVGGVVAYEGPDDNPLYPNFRVIPSQVGYSSYLADFENPGASPGFVCDLGHVWSIGSGANCTVTGAGGGSCRTALAGALDLTPLFQVQGPVTSEARDIVGGRGMMYVRIRIRYHQPDASSSGEGCFRPPPRA